MSGARAKNFIAEVGHRLTERTLVPRSETLLVQRLAITIQRGYAASVLCTFAPGSPRGGIEYLILRFYFSFKLLLGLFTEYLSLFFYRFII